jgi:hypothetical protein
MLLLLCILSNDSMDYSFEYVLFRHHTLHVLDQIIGFSGLVILEVVNNQVKSRFWDHVYQRRQHLKSIFPSSENNKVVPQQVIISEDIPCAG